MSQRDLFHADKPQPTLADDWRFQALARFCRVFGSDAIIALDIPTRQGVRHLTREGC